MDPMLILSGNLCLRNLILKIPSRSNISEISLGSRCVIGGHENQEINELIFSGSRDNIC